MKLRTKRFKPVNTLLTRADSRAPRTSTPVGKTEYETCKITKSIDTESRHVVARGWGIEELDGERSAGMGFPSGVMKMFGTRQR